MLVVRVAPLGVLCTAMLGYLRPKKLVGVVELAEVDETDATGRTGGPACEPERRNLGAWASALPISQTTTRGELLGSAHGLNRGATFA
jgi:hypothetical protein